MNTYLIESNLAAWSVDAENELTAVCGWIVRGMRAQDEGRSEKVAVRELGGAGDVTYPLKGLDAAAFGRFMAEHRASIEKAAATVRHVSIDERQFHLTAARLDRANSRIGRLEQTCRSVAMELAEHSTGLSSDRAAQLRSRILVALGEGGREVKAA